MKRAAAGITALAILLYLVGCGGGTGGTQAQALPMMMEASQAMGGVNSYRVSGSMVMQASALGQDGASVPLEMKSETEIRISGGEMRQYMRTTMDGFSMETYMIGDQVYACYPTQGWIKMNVAMYRTQDLGTGMLGPENIELMAEMASEAEVIEEGEGKVGLAFHLDEEYLRAGLEMYREYLGEMEETMPEGWLEQTEQSIAGFEADIVVWLWKDSKLLDSMEGEYSMQGTETTGMIEGTMRYRVFDYNADIEIELPPEAEGAEEVTLP